MNDIVSREVLGTTVIWQMISSMCVSSVENVHKASGTESDVIKKAIITNFD